VSRYWTALMVARTVPVRPGPTWSSTVRNGIDWADQDVRLAHVASGR